ncbi:MAG TPA: pyrrolo-quinoline quinone, partial [Verrucomicrobia bacterium]|nr:pyrrolo-quinoline quinone [Verrucomicrobiota bacterium]
MNQGLCLKLLLLNLTLQSGIAENWTQFRGQNGTGVSKEWNLTEHPVTGRDIAWKIDLPGRGLSSPIIIENRAFVTCSSGIHQDRLHVICYNIEKGEEIWHRQFWATGRTMTQQKTCVAASTPTSDGSRIFALFSSNDLICLDLNGNLKWLRGLTVDYPNAGNSLGMAASPIIAENTLIIQTEADSESLALGIDPETGLNLWKRERPRNANWTSPLTLKTTGGSSIIALQSSRGIEAIHPKTGKVVWSYDDGAATIPSSASNGEILFVPSHGITALKIQPGADSFTQIWRKRQFNPGTASPIAIANRIYTVNNAGDLTCGD